MADRYPIADTGSGASGPVEVDIADVTGLQTALNGKAASTHTHAAADVTDLVATLADFEARIATLEGGGA